MTGPGSFRVQLLDRLYDLAPEDLDALVRLEVLSGETTTP